MHNIYDLEAEKCVLSIMITEPNKREYVFEKLKRKDFYLGWHKDIFSAILELSRENTNVDPITVINKMEAMGFDTESNNGIVGVVEIVNAVAFPSNIENLMSFMFSGCLKLIPQFQKYLLRASRAILRHQLLRFDRCICRKSLCRRL